MYGRGELGGWLWISRTLVRDIRESPSFPLMHQSGTVEVVDAVLIVYGAEISDFVGGRVGQEGKASRGSCDSPEAVENSAAVGRKERTQRGMRVLFA